MALLTRATSREDEDYLAHLAYHDPLTDLPNRVRLAERLCEALPRAVDGASVALLSIDLDAFKTVNDSLGRDAGDDLLRQVARRLDSIRRTNDMLVRQGGDEFTLLAELEAGLDATAVAVAMAERIRSVLEESFTLADAELRITASVGAAIYPEDALDARALLRNADSAMYEAKEDESGFALYRPGAANPMARNSLSSTSRRYLTISAAPVGRRISRPGTKNRSSPGQLSLAIAAPHAAASNSRTEGEYPAITISRRVMFSVSRDDEYRCGCQRGFRCTMCRTLRGHATSFGYCGPATVNRISGSARAASKRNSSSFGCRSGA